MSLYLLTANALVSLYCELVNNQWAQSREGYILEVYVILVFSEKIVADLI